MPDVAAAIVDTGNYVAAGGCCCTGSVSPHGTAAGSRPLAVGQSPWIFCFRIHFFSGDICSSPYMHGTASMDPQPNVFVVNLFIVGNNEW